MQTSTSDSGPDTVIEGGAPSTGAMAPLLRHYVRTLLAIAGVLLALVLALGTYAYQRQKTQLLLNLHEQAVLTQQALQQRLDLVHNHVLGMRFAMERSLRWPVLADSGFVDRVQQRNLSPLRDAPWERLPVDLVRELGALHMDPNAVLDAGVLRRDLGAVSAALPAMAALHNSTPSLWSSYYLDATLRWRYAYPAQGRDDRLRASGSSEMGAALRSLWPGTSIQPLALTRAALDAQRQASWTAPFAGAKGLGVALLAPIMLGPEQVGVVGTDIGLDLLDAQLVQHAPPLGRMFIVNAQGYVLGDSAGGLGRATAPLRLADLVPDAGSPWLEASPTGAWTRLALRDSDLFLLHQLPPQTLRNAALAPLKPFVGLALLTLLTLAVLALWQHRHFTLPALRLVQYLQQLEQSPQRKAPPAPALWAPWFAQLAQAAREREALHSATLRHTRQQQEAQDSRQAEADHSAAALLQAQEALAACQQQLLRAERLAALGGAAAKATQTLLPLINQVQKTAATMHQHNEALQQGLLHGTGTQELQQQALQLDQTTLALNQQLQAMTPVVQQLRQASTDPTREAPRRFALYTLAEQVLAQLPANLKREGIHIANGIARDIELHTRAQGCGQLLGQTLAQTLAQAFAAGADGIVRLSAKTTRDQDGIDVVVLQITDNGTSHPCVVPEHTQRALLQVALGGRVEHQAAQGANICTLTLTQFLEVPTELPASPPPALPELPST